MLENTEEKLEEEQKTLALPIVDNKLTPEKERAAVLLAEGKTQTKVGEILGHTKQTINAWCHEPEFRKLVSELKSNALKQVEEMLENGMPSAARAVLDIVQGNVDIEDPRLITARLKAALWILDRHKKTSGLAPSKKKEVSLPVGEKDLDEIMDRVT